VKLLHRVGRQKREITAVFEMGAMPGLRITQTRDGQTLPLGGKDYALVTEFLLSEDDAFDRQDQADSYRETMKRHWRMKKTDLILNRSLLDEEDPRDVSNSVVVVFGKNARVFEKTDEYGWLDLGHALSDQVDSLDGYTFASKVDDEVLQASLERYLDPSRGIQNREKAKKLFEQPLGRLTISDDEKARLRAGRMRTPRAESLDQKLIVDNSRRPVEDDDFDLDDIAASLALK
jgi:hypothetical protein